MKLDPPGGAAEAKAEPTVTRRTSRGLAGGEQGWLAVFSGGELSLLRLSHLPRRPQRRRQANQPLLASPLAKARARSRRRAVSAPRQRFSARCQACHAPAMASPEVLASGLLALSLIFAEES